MILNSQGSSLVLLVLLNQVTAWSVAIGIGGLFQLGNDPLFTFIIAGWAMGIAVSLTYFEEYIF